MFHEILLITNAISPEREREREKQNVINAIYFDRLCATRAVSLVVLSFIKMVQLDLTSNSFVLESWKNSRTMCSSPLFGMFESGKRQPAPAMLLLLILYQTSSSRYEKKDRENRPTSVRSQCPMNSTRNLYLHFSFFFARLLSRERMNALQ